MLSRLYFAVSVEIWCVSVFVLCLTRKCYFTGIYLSSAAVAFSDRRSPNATRTCEFYNETMCAESRGQGGEQGCYERERCDDSDKHDPTKRSHCFVLWHTDSDGKMTIKLKVSK